MPIVPLSDLLRTRVTWAMIVAAWTIVLASAIDPLFPDARGLAFGGNAANTVAFFLFYIGIVAVTWAVGVIAIKALTAARADDESD